MPFKCYSTAEDDGSNAATDADFDDYDNDDDDNDDDDDQQLNELYKTNNK